MKINGNEIRPGNVILHKGELWRVVKTGAVQPGKGGAYAQAELRHVINGSKHNERFRASQAVERVRLDQRAHQFLYAEGDMLAFMDMESYEQISLPKSLVGERIAWLRDAIEVMIESHEGTPIGVEFPEAVTAVVVETEPALKGQTAASSYKPATLDNGLRISVPPFIDVGQKIIVNADAMSYVKRADA